MKTKTESQKLVEEIDDVISQAEPNLMAKWLFRLTVLVAELEDRLDTLDDQMNPND